MNKAHRNTIFVEDCRIIEHQKHKGGQYIIKLQTKNIAKNTKSGQFVHISCGANILMRRPISIMLANKENNTIDLLYKVIGIGTKELSKHKVGGKINIMGPIGNKFELYKDKTMPLLIGGGVGMPPMIALSYEIKSNRNYKQMVILGSEQPFPFKVVTSKMKNNWCAKNGSINILEDLCINTRLTSLQDYEKVNKGYVTGLARKYINSLSATDKNKVIVYACGPKPMLEAVHKLAKEYNLKCQVSLEEHMACAVGGCAGCVIEINNKSKKQMQRVCVDGPIFDSYSVFE